MIGIIKVSRNIKELGIKVKEVEREHFLKYGETATAKQIAEILNSKKREL